MTRSPGDIARWLDERFRVAEYPPDMPFSSLVPEVYRASGRDPSKLFRQGYVPACQGLMLEGPRPVERAVLAVFLSDEIVQAISGAGVKDALLFTHHPLDMETSGRGFLPLSDESLRTLSDLGISVYTLHNPLDRDGFISTSRALARVLGMVGLGPFTPDGVIGLLPRPAPLRELTERLARALDLPEVHSIQRTEEVRRIAVVAGGGSRSRFFRQAVAAGADTYLTGTYDNQIQNERAEEHRRELAEFLAEGAPLNLVEGSHYATEVVVLVEDIAPLLRAELGLDVQFVRQRDPWH